MADDKDIRAGMISGVLAVIMVILLSVMAFTALQPAAVGAYHADAVGEADPDNARFGVRFG